LHGEKLGHSRKQIRYTPKIFKRCAGEDPLDESCDSEEVLNGAEKERSFLSKVKRRKADWIGHILPRNCLLKHVAE
jgi:hypothetical protein